MIGAVVLTIIGDGVGRRWSLGDGAACGFRRLRPLAARATSVARQMIDVEKVA